MKKIIQQITELQEKIANHRPFSEELLASIQERLRIEWTYNSNAIEGNTLTYGETAFFLREGLTSEGRPLKDYLEAKNHAEAIDWLNSQIQEKRKLTESFIKELHSLLLRDIHFTYAKGSSNNLIKKPLNPGKYKIRPNHVLTISGKIHHYTDPLHVKDEMEKLIKWLNSEKSQNSIEKAAIFHYKFVTIHPFDDGNGRMARLLMNLILLLSGFPPCIIKNTNRRKYLQSLERVDQTKDYTNFISFIASELLSTQNVIYDTIRGKTPPVIESLRLNKADRERMIIHTLELAENSLSISQIHEQIPQIKRPTLKKDLKILVKLKKIKARGKGKGVTYSL